MSAEACEYMSRNQMYTATDVTSHKLELNMVNKIDVIPIGSLTDDTNIYCEGESVLINGKIVNNILKLQTFNKHKCFGVEILLCQPSNSYYCVSLRQLAVALTINGQGNHQLGGNKRRLVDIFIIKYTQV